MTIDVYQKGDLMRVSALFANIAGTATDPSAVTFTYRPPSGTSVTLTYGVDAALEKDSTGNYHVDLDLIEAGWWHYTFKGTGTVQQVEHGEFMVPARAQ
jgi:hypothetical protein